MKSIYFVTGNQEKLIDARGVCDNYDISIEQQPVHVDEIQHHDPRKITEHKAKSAYAIIKKPLVVNDSSWQIPALGGFPGGYMKDVAAWLSEADFLNLMADKADHTIILNETVAYYDGQVYKEFTDSKAGKFLKTALDLSGISLGNVVAMDCDNGLAINEVLKKRRDGNYPVLSENYGQWQAFAEWFSAQD